MIKRYLLFAGKFEYPNGGISDLKGDFNTIKNTINFIIKQGYFDWYQIVDSKTMKSIITYNEGAK
jgi:hypothetical protein